MAEKNFFSTNSVPFAKILIFQVLKISPKLISRKNCQNPSCFLSKIARITHFAKISSKCFNSFPKFFRHFSAYCMISPSHVEALTEFSFVSHVFCKRIVIITENDAPKSCTLVDSDSKMHKNDILPDHEI